MTRISYRHVWQPGETKENFASGMTALTADSPQGNDGYGSFPVHRLFFKRPAS